jgi:hypothetical protein
MQATLTPLEGQVNAELGYPMQSLLYRRGTFVVFDFAVVRLADDALGFYGDARGMGESVRHLFASREERAVCYFVGHDSMVAAASKNLPAASRKTLPTPFGR